MKRVIYFGTDGCPGHYAIPIIGDFSWQERREITKAIDSSRFEEMFAGGVRAAIFRYSNYLCYGVPYSPDDNRGGSRTVVLVENGTTEDLWRVLREVKFIKSKFAQVYKEHDFPKQENLYEIDLTKKYFLENGEVFGSMIELNNKLEPVYLYTDKPEFEDETGE